MALLWTLIVLTTVGVRSTNAEPPCDRNNTVDVTTGVLHANDSITFEGVNYPNGTWSEVYENGTTARLGCDCKGRTCIWKCCGPDEEFLGRECVPAADVFEPPVYDGAATSAVAAGDHFNYIYGIPCPERYLVDTDASGNAVYLKKNGTLLEVTSGRSLWHSPGEYCLDSMVADGGGNETRSRLVAVVCYPQAFVDDDDNPILYTMYAVGMLLSVPCLLATLIIYAWIPELRNLHGLCLISYCGGLIVAYVLLAYLKLRAGEVHMGMSGCLTLAFIIYYSFQTSFFWLNVMCFDIWRTFSGYRGSSTGKRRELKRFGMYGAYAWGVPLLLTAVTAGMQFADDLPPHIIRPNFGERRCWFEDWKNELVYFMTPVLVLVVCNTILFAVTAKRIHSIRQETAILKSSESSRSDKLRRDKQRYALYLKLFVVMGINWSIELISFAVGGSNLYWIMIDLSNIALGLFIFIIFVWKNKARTLVRKKFRRVPIRSGTESGTRWETRSSSAPTEDTRVTSDDGAIRLKDTH